MLIKIAASYEAANFLFALRDLLGDRVPSTGENDKHFCGVIYGNEMISAFCIFS